MARDVFQTLDNLAEEIGSLRKQLHGLYSVFGGAVTPSRRVRRKVRKVTRKARKAVSPAVHAKRILQGKYLAALRPLSAASRAKVKAVFARKGHAAAIRVAARLKQ